MSNNDLLTRAEYDSYRPHLMMIDGIERFRSSFGVGRDEFRIVDWGCGRGTFVLWLRERGYSAFGVDVSTTRPFAAGRLRPRAGCRWTSGPCVLCPTIG